MFNTLKLIRQVHITAIKQLPRRSTLRANPGIARQMEALGTHEPFFKDPEGFGDVETDFMNVHKSHKQLAIEEQQQRDKIRQIMIKHKYFREPKMPNLLTYAEKEQIRLLHSRDPEEWSVEQLADSFPATPEVIRKLLDNKWRPRSIKRIRSHDAGVIRNWELLQAADEEFVQQLTPKLREHLKKFTHRTRADLENIMQSKTIEHWPTRPQLSEPKSKEFQSIVTRCWTKPKNSEEQLSIAVKDQPKNKLNSKETQSKAAPVDELPPHDPADETYLLNKVVDRRNMRLQELKMHKLTPSELEYLGSSSSASVSQQNAARADNAVQRLPLENPAGTGIVDNSHNNASLSNFSIISKFESNEVVISVADQKRYEMTKVKDRIYIPKSLRKQGATYRIEDCYYDDDGEFLYRVPGMTRQQQ